ncbi:MAG: ABC transporter permease [Candidatus Pacebacteria bacterium]|jgi:cell division transport system permease protein|nr:ABC transporter permease [Candidatus Paceibacterota bacterium]
MVLTDLKRIVRSGYTNFMRSGFTSASSVLIMTITLFVITSIFFVQTALTSALADIREKVDVTVYFVPNANEVIIKNVESALKKLPEVKQVTYTSQEDALALFRDRHADDYLTLQALDELKENPLGASLNIKAKDPSQYESIAKYFDGDTTISKGAMTLIDNVDYRQNKLVIDRLGSIVSGAKRLGFAVSLIFICISVIITFNTIRLIIFMSREEINVMRLVGAGTRYIRGPFMVSGMLVGIVSAIITMMLFIPVSIWLGNQMTDFIGINLFTYYKQNIFQLFSMMLGFGVILGAISSSFAIARYLRK